MNERSSDASLAVLPKNCIDKEPLVRRVLAADPDYLLQSNQTIDRLCSSLPTWDQVVELYGPKPIIVGMETCPAFRANVQTTADRQPQPRVAGLFHTGTNAMAQLLQVNNVSNEKITWYRDYDVPWGKHGQVHRRRRMSESLVRNVLPIVLIRDPLRWMQKLVSETKV